MSDLCFDLDPVSDLFDLVFATATLAVGDDLATPVLVSLFTDARARADDELPVAGDMDRRGWWGDAFPATAAANALGQDRIGSRLWLLSRALQIPETLVRARQYAEEALAWMVDDGIASSVTAEASFPRDGWLQLEIAIDRPDGSGAAFAWALNWDAQILRSTVAGRVG